MCRDWRGGEGGEVGPAGDPVTGKPSAQIFERNVVDRKVLVLRNLYLCDEDTKD